MASQAAGHRFNAVSLVLGVLALTGGLIVLGGGSLLDDATVLLPTGMIALGVAIVLQVRARRVESSDPATAPRLEAGLAGPAISGADLYDLLVPDPTEQFLAEVAERERSVRSPRGEHPAVDTGPTGAGPSPDEPDRDAGP